MNYNLTPNEIRKKIRQGQWDNPTYGFAPGYAQVSPVIIQEKYANDFLEFCRLNSQTFPLYGQSEPGSSKFPFLGNNIDMKSDLPSYRIYRDGRFDQNLNNVTAVWQDDFVSFAIGCSLSFEELLINQGIPLRHLQENKQIPAYKTNISLREAGAFKGKIIATMRHFSAENAIQSRSITSQFPLFHGSPLHEGDPSQLGIKSLLTPDYGESPELRDGDVTQFWACGMTIFNVMEQAKLPIAIIVNPGYMLITDLEIKSLCGIKPETLSNI